MKKLVLMLVAVLATASLGWANTLPCSNTTDYADYVANGFECTAKSLTFSAFSLGAGSNLAANQITVATAPDGLTFSFMLTTTSMNPSQQNLNIGFDVDTSVTEGFVFAGLSFVGTGTDPGVTASVNETVPGGPLEVYQKTPGSDDTMTVTSAGVLLGGQTMLSVTDSALVSTVATGAPRTATITSFTNTFVPAPEPPSLALLGLGALALACLRPFRSRTTGRLA
jgi:hypothetical protein